MTRLAIVLVLCLALDCGKDKPKPPPTPLPTPSPAPTLAPTPTPSPIPKPSPAPTPNVDFTPYLHTQGGRVMTVIEPEGDLGAAINSIDAMLGAEPGKIVVQGGGSIKSHTTITHDFEYHGDIKCDLLDEVNPCISLGNNIYIEGFGVIYGPEGVMYDGRPAVTVFQASEAPHGENHKITFKNVRIEGRNPRLNDGGLRQAVSLGNCVDCAFIGGSINRSSGIGLQFGGTSDNGFHARRGVVTGAAFSENAAAHIAIVNASGMDIWSNTISKPGRVGGPGGVSGIDLETNSERDWMENINIDSNTIDFSLAASNSIGSGILAQQTGSTHTSGLRIRNNRIVGALPLGGLTSGIYFTGEFPGGLVAGNYIERAMQSCFQLYGSRGVTFQDNECNTTGGGGLPAIQIVGGGGNIFKRNRLWIDPAIGGSSSTDIFQQDSPGNIIEPYTIRRRPR